jgi:hypothetical protein
VFFLHALCDGENHKTREHNSHADSEDFVTLYGDDNRESGLTRSHCPHPPHFLSGRNRVSPRFEGVTVALEPRQIREVMLLSGVEALHSVL